MKATFQFATGDGEIESEHACIRPIFEIRSSLLHQQVRLSNRAGRPCGKWPGPNYIAFEVAL